MANLLFVTCSLFGERSKSRQLAVEFIAAWRRRHPDTSVVEHDLFSAPIAHLTAVEFEARRISAEQCTDAVVEARARGEREIARLEHADVIVIAAPMTNFSIPSTLKTWIDHVVCAGRTFRYGPSGPEGLLKNKQVFVISARGGVYSGGGSRSASDHFEPYLRCILGYIGLTDVTFIPVEGQGKSETAIAGVASARESIQRIVGEDAVDSGHNLVRPLQSR
jgi:FMN-dependent NADH-azoreductase